MWLDMIFFEILMDFMEYIIGILIKYFLKLAMEIFLLNAESHFRTKRD